MACSEAGDALEVVRTVIAEPTREFAIIHITQRHDVSLLKASLDTLHADGKQTPSLLFESITGAGVENQASHRLGRKADPPLSRRDGRTLGQDECPNRLTA